MDTTAATAARAAGNRMRLGVLVALLVVAGCGPSNEDALTSTSTVPPATTIDVRSLDDGADLDAAVPDDAVVPAPPSDLTLPPTPAPAPAPPAPSATNAPTQPGAYTYAVTGTVGGETVLGASTLSVSGVDGQRRQTHTERTPGGTTITVYRYADDGRYLESVSIATSSGELELVAEEPLLLVPAGARAGTSTTGRLSGQDAVAQVSFTLIELDTERMIHQTVTRLAARVDATCLVTGVVSTTTASRSSDQLPLDIRAESDMETSGSESCAGRTESRIRSLLDQ